MESQSGKSAATLEDKEKWASCLMGNRGREVTNEA